MRKDEPRVYDRIDAIRTDDARGYPCDKRQDAYEEERMRIPLVEADFLRPEEREQGVQDVRQHAQRHR